MITKYWKSMIDKYINDKKFLNKKLEEGFNISFRFITKSVILLHLIFIYIIGYLKNII